MLDFLTDHMYVVAAAFLGIAVLARLLQERLWGAKLLLTAACFLAVTSMAIAPTLQRMAFEKQMVSEYGGYPWMKLIQATRTTEPMEPMTWIYPPIGHFRFVGPASPMGRVDGDERLLLQKVHRLAQDPETSEIQARCNERRYRLKEPDGQGGFSNASTDWFSMHDADFSFVCVEDWSNEQRIFRG